MKPICAAVAIAVVMLTAGCASTWPPSGSQTGQPVTAAASKPPRLSVGTSYPDTELILPWFLTDIINFVNDP
jgi:hypothetical protein